MRKAIQLSNKDYKNLQNNLSIVEKQIYRASLNNIKKVINTKNYYHFYN